MRLVPPRYSDSEIALALWRAPLTPGFAPAIQCANSLADRLASPPAALLPYHSAMPLPRRSFLKSAAVACPTLAVSSFLRLGPGASPALAQSAAAPATVPLHVVGAGQDRLGDPHSMGISSLAFKVLSADTGGNLFVIEHSHLVPGGPPLHLHLYQDEWFYVMQGKVAFQVGDRRLELSPGESVLGPRRIPHAFASVAPQSQLLIAFTPAGKMEQFFLDGAANPALALTSEFMNRYEMQWIGPSPLLKP